MGAFFIAIFNIFSITVYTHATTFGQCISVFCLLLLWPHDTKWQALSLSSWVLLKVCLMGTKPLPGQIHTTCNKWLAISKLRKIWSSWPSTFCDVITTCKYSSVHSAPDVYIIHRSFNPVPWVMLSSFDANPQAAHFVICVIYSLSWTYLERKSQIWLYATNESSLVQRILKMRGHVHNCPFESIWFAILQLLCTMSMSNIYSYF